MVGATRSTSLRMALAAWLLLMNLSLGLYHQHEAEESASASAHRAAPSAWHYHLVLLGVELDFLSLNTETSPFGPNSSADKEAHLLLCSVLAPFPEHDSSPNPALVLSAMALLDLPVLCTPHDELSRAPASTRERTGLPPPQIALGARSGVQQV
jgi:hypothetical protein